MIFETKKKCFTALLSGNKILEVSYKFIMLYVTILKIKYRTIFFNHPISNFLSKSQAHKIVTLK